MSAGSGRMDDRVSWLTTRRALPVAKERRAEWVRALGAGRASFGDGA